MASFTRSFFFIAIVLSTLLNISTQIHARESYFFHRFQRDKTQDKNPSSAAPVEANPKTTSGGEVVPKNEEEQQDQDPSFVPQSENGYGLYGHETTYNNNNNEEEFNKKYEENVSYEPFNTPSLSETEDSFNSDKYSKDNENYDDKNNVDNYDNNEKNNYNYNNNDNYYNSNAYGRERSYNGYNNNNNVERQGMSDTRFVENGRYYFDVNDDKNHGESYKKRYRHTPSYYGASSNYDRFGQNNNGGSFYDNNGQRSFQDPYNSKWEKNMTNEQEQEQEFGEEQQDQFVP